MRLPAWTGHHRKWPQDPCFEICRNPPQATSTRALYCWCQNFLRTNCFAVLVFSRRRFRRQRSLFSDIFWDSSRVLAIVSEVLGHGTSSVWCQELQRCCLSEGEKGNLALPVVESCQYWYGMWISAWKIQQRSSQGRRGTTNWVGYLKPRQGASDAVAATTVVYFRQSSDLRT